MQKLASPFTLPRLLAAMCVVLASCGTDEDVRPVVNPSANEFEDTADVEAELLGTWTAEQVRISFMDINGQSDLKHLLVWSGWPEQYVIQKLASLESELRPEFAGDISFTSDQTYDSNMEAINNSGKWLFRNHTLILDAGLAGTTVLPVKLISSSTLEVLYVQYILEDLDNDAETPEVSIIVNTRITLTK